MYYPLIQLFTPYIKNCSIKNILYVILLICFQLKRHQLKANRIKSALPCKRFSLTKFVNLFYVIKKSWMSPCINGPLQILMKNNECVVLKIVHIIIFSYCDEPKYIWSRKMMTNMVYKSSSCTFYGLLVWHKK